MNEQEQEKNGLVGDEPLIIDHLNEAWNLFVKLPKQHPSDNVEFQKNLHELQRLLAIRIARRQFPGYWHNQEKIYNQNC